MQEKILSKQKTRTSNIHSMDFGAFLTIFLVHHIKKTGSFLATDSLDFGYLGKPYNADTELYDYGSRDYSPEIARFTSVDPIRDDRNWYCYVVNDPVNYVDLWGCVEVMEIVNIIQKTVFCGIGGEAMIGLNGIKLGFDLGMGAGIQITWKKEEK